MKILIIEDDAALRSVYREMLEYAGHNVTQASSPQAAKDFYQDSFFNIVLSDAMFDTHSSRDIEPIFKLWQGLQSKGSRIIVISGEPALRQRVEDASMTFLLKPVAVSDLITLIEQS